MSKLFSSFKIGQLELANRIIIAPMCQYSADQGMASSWHTMHWGNMAFSGAGLFIVEATAISPEGRISPGDLGLYDDQCEKAIADCLTEVRKYSSMPFAIQLAHAGRKASVQRPWQGAKQILPNQPQGWQTVAPSAVGFNKTDALPQELSLEQIEKIKNQFVDSAKRAVNLGFHGIEIHAAHGYLLHEFLSPLSNLRKDNYGGSLENRMRFPLETFKAVKDALPANYPLWIRISATDWVDGGWTLPESIQFCKELKKCGSDLIHVSSGGLSPEQQIPVEPNYQVRFSEQIKKEVGIPTIAVGLITESQQAEKILQNNQADAIGLARIILYNPHWPWHVAAELGAQVKVPAQYLRSQPIGLKSLLVQDA